MMHTQASSGNQKLLLFSGNLLSGLGKKIVILYSFEFITNKTIQCFSSLSHFMIPVNIHLTPLTFNTTERV